MCVVGNHHTRPENDAYDDILQNLQCIMSFAVSVAVSFLDNVYNEHLGNCGTSDAYDVCHDFSSHVNLKAMGYLNFPNDLGSKRDFPCVTRGNKEMANQYSGLLTGPDQPWTQQPFTLNNESRSTRIVCTLLWLSLFDPSFVVRCRVVITDDVTGVETDGGYNEFVGISQKRTIIELSSGRGVMVPARCGEKFCRHEETQFGSSSQYRRTLQ